MSLFWRVVAINAGGLVVAALVLARSPATVSPTLTVTEGAVLTVGTLALIAVNIVLLRPGFPRALSTVAQPLSQRGDQHQPGIADDVLVVERDPQTDARAEFERAFTLTQNARERSVLLERIASCSARGENRQAAMRARRPPRRAT